MKTKYQTELDQFHAKVHAIAKAVHAKMMINGMSGIYTPIVVCGSTVTCADDCQSVINRFTREFYRVEFDAINKAHAEFCGEVTA